MSDAVHLRIEMSEELKGTIHAGVNARVFITIPGLPEVRLPATTRVRTFFGLDDATTARIDLLCSTEITYTHLHTRDRRGACVKAGRSLILDYMVPAVCWLGVALLALALGAVIVELG